MIQRFSALLTLLFMLCAMPMAYAIEVSTEDDWRFGINGFLDAQYNYIGSIPTVSGVVGAPTLAKAPIISNLSQQHLNLLFSAQKENTKFFINFDSHPPLSEVHAGGSTTQIRLAEAYGEVKMGDGWVLRVGQFNAPFSIFNEVSYVLPLFASVNLPLMYLMPGHYHGGVDAIKDSASVRHNLMPAQANFMVSNHLSTDDWDWELDIYLSAGARSYKTPSLDGNVNKGLGARFQVSDTDERLTLGFSAYTVNNDGAGENPALEDVGDELLIGSDVVVKLWQEQLQIELEWVYNQFENRDDRLASALRLTNRFNDTSSAYISLQYMRDDAHPIYYRGMNVYSAGYTYNYSTNVMLKTEYHLHQINTDDTTGLVLPESTDRFSMIKSSLSFMF